jgi:hypothetical protein
VEQSFKRCCITNVLDGAEDGVLWDDSDLDCPDLKGGVEESVDLESETEGIGEVDGEWIHLFNLDFQFCIA